MRRCSWCDWKEEPGDDQKSELVKHADHLATHNPSPAQWTEAYRKGVEPYLTKRSM